jgi:hypothetical protein
VQNWDYEKGGYKVSRFYQITAPEVTMKVLVPVHSSSDDLGGMRKWYVIFPQLNMIRMDYTLLGQALLSLQGRGAEFLKSQWDELYKSKALKSLPDKTDWDKNIMGRGPLKEVRAQYEEVIKGNLPLIMFQVRKVDALNAWRIENGKPQLDYFVSAHFPGPKAMPAVSADFKFTLECQESVVPPGQDQPDPVLFPVQPHWKIKAFEITGLAPMK